jgi:hypothetical protein
LCRPRLAGNLGRHRIVAQLLSFPACCEIRLEAGTCTGLTCVKTVPERKLFQSNVLEKMGRYLRCCQKLLRNQDGTRTSEIILVV